MYKSQAGFHSTDSGRVLFCIDFREASTGGVQRGYSFATVSGRHSLGVLG